MLLHYCEKTFKGSQKGLFRETFSFLGALKGLFRQYVKCDKHQKNRELKKRSAAQALLEDVEGKEPKRSK